MCDAITQFQTVNIIVDGRVHLRCDAYLWNVSRLRVVEVVCCYHRHSRDCGLETATRHMKADNGNIKSVLHWKCPVCDTLNYSLRVVCI
jgi:hypothetical protein